MATPVGAALDANTLALWRLDDLTQRNILLQSEDLSVAPWTSGGVSAAGPTVTPRTTDLADPAGFSQAMKVVIPSVSGAGAVSELSQAFTGTTGGYNLSVWLRTLSGTATVYLSILRGSAYATTACNVTTTWTRFSVASASGTAGTSYWILGIDLRDGAQSSKPAQTVYAYRAQASIGTALLAEQRTVSVTSNADDVAPHGYALASVGAVAVATTGQVANAVAFGANTGLHQTGDASAGSALQGDYTIEAWVRPRTGFTAGAVLAAYHGINFTTSNGDLKLLDLEIAADRRPTWQQYQTTGGVTSRTFGTALPLDAWSHVVVSRQGQGGNLWTFRSYINGALVDTLTGVAGITTPITGASHWWTLGSYRTSGNGAGASFVGDLDDVRVSSVRRSDADILATYNAGAGIVVVPPAPASVAAVVDAGTGVARDLLLDPLTGDLAMTAGDLVLARGRVAVRQAVQQAIQLFRGEWFLDLDAGLPLFEEILVKNPNLNAIRAALAASISAVPGVVSLDSLTLAYDAGARSLAVAWTATGDTGALSGTATLGAA